MRLVPPDVDPDLGRRELERHGHVHEERAQQAVILLLDEHLVVQSEQRRRRGAKAIPLLREILRHLVSGSEPARSQRAKDVAVVR